METPKAIQAILSELMAAPSLDLARQLEQQLAGLGYRKMVFGRINQKASIEAASEGDRGVVERLANAFDASLTAARVMSGMRTNYRFESPILSDDLLALLSDAKLLVVKRGRAGGIYYPLK
jgi:hypothetical protein